MIEFEIEILPMFSKPFLSKIQNISHNSYVFTLSPSLLFCKCQYEYLVLTIIFLNTYYTKYLPIAFSQSPDTAFECGECDFVYIDV